MPGPFSITTPTNTLTLGTSRQGSASFLVTNTSGRPVRGRALLHWVPENPAANAWLSLDGAAERDYPIAGTQQYAVKVQVPPDAPEGAMTLRLDMLDVAHADDAPTEGQTVTLTVPAPAPPRPFPWWVLVVAVVIVVAGAAAYLLLGRGTTVPNDLTGLSLVQAGEKLTSAGLKASDTPKTQASATVPKGQVAGSDPPGGQKVNKGAAVTLIVSSGPELVTVPDLSGSESDAKARLTAAKLVYDGTDQVFNAAPAGQIFALVADGQPHVAGDQLVSGTKVRLQMSRGPELVTVPTDIVGQDFAAVYNRLAGLTISVSRPYNNAVASGHVISTDPPPGSQVPKGNPLTVSVSAGPCPRPTSLGCRRLSDVFVNPNVRFDPNLLNPAHP